MVLYNLFITLGLLLILIFYLLLIVFIMVVFKYVFLIVITFYVVLVWSTEYCFFILTTRPILNLSSNPRFINVFPNFHESPMVVKIKMLFLFREALLFFHNPLRIKRRWDFRDSKSSFFIVFLFFLALGSLFRWLYILTFIIGFTLYLLGLMKYIFSKSTKDFSLHNSRLIKLISGFNFRLIWPQFVKYMYIERPLYIAHTLIYKVAKLVMGKRDRRKLSKSRLFFLSTRLVLLLLFVLLYYTTHPILLNSLLYSPHILEHNILYPLMCFIPAVLEGWKWADYFPNMWLERNCFLSYRRQAKASYRMLCSVAYTRILGFEFSVVIMSPALNYRIYNTNSSRWNFNPKKYVVTQVPHLPTRLVFDFQDSAKLLSIISRLKEHVISDNLYLSGGKLVKYSKVHRHQYINLRSRVYPDDTHILSVERSHFKRNPQLTNSVIDYGGYGGLHLSKPIVAPTTSFGIADDLYIRKPVYLEGKVHETILIDTLVSLDKPQVIYLLPQRTKLLRDLVELSGVGQDILKGHNLVLKDSLFNDIGTLRKLMDLKLLGHDDQLTVILNELVNLDQLSGFNESVDITYRFFSEKLL